MNKYIINVEFEVKDRQESHGFCQEYWVEIRYHHPILNRMESFNIKQKEKQSYKSFIREMFDLLRDKNQVKYFVKKDANEKIEKYNDSLSEKALERKINALKYSIEVEI